MIQFFIENHEIILPDDFSFTQVDGNPLITNNGEFTLDITISLLTGKNARAAKFINRINKIDIDSTYNALMIDDGKYKHGTIIIQNNTNKDLTFQFVAGNSELNYLANNEKKIWELDWGTEMEIDFNAALRSCYFPGYGEKYQAIRFEGNISRLTWTQKYVCAPVMVGGEIYNKYIFNEFLLTIPNSIVNIENIIMQPYLMYYIKKLPELLGYTLKSNCLETDERALKMFIVNSVSSLNYADALPDMTISEFISEIESFFNVSFLVNAVTKSIEIQNLKTSFKNKKIIKLKSVLDNYERDLSADSVALRISYTKYAYSLSDSTYYRYQRLLDDVLAKIKICEFENLAALKNWAVNSHESTNQLYIYRDLEKNEDYCYCDPSLNLYKVFINNEGDGSTAQFMNLINKFAPYGTSNDQIYELKIIPSEITSDFRTVKWYNISGQEMSCVVASQLPKSSNTFFKSESKNFIDTVESPEQQVQRISVLETALFSGVCEMIVTNWTMAGKAVLTYPYSHVDFYPDFGPEGTDPNRFTDFDLWYNTKFKPLLTKTLRLNGIGGVISDYQMSSIIDTSKTYIFDMMDSPDVLAENIFEYNNQQYVPVSFERTKSRKKSLVKGTFYRML